MERMKFLQLTINSICIAAVSIQLTFILRKAVPKKSIERTFIISGGGGGGGGSVWG